MCKANNIFPGNDSIMMVDSPKKYAMETIAAGCRLNPIRGVEEYKQNIVNLRDQLIQLLKTKVSFNMLTYE